MSTPTIVTREEVGLLEPRPITPRPVDRIVGLVLHHAGVSYGDGADFAAVWRSIQRYHMAPHGTEGAHSDIDYNAGVAPDGTVFLGRDAAVRGAHDAAPGINDHWTGLVFLGDYRDGHDELTDEAWRSALFMWQTQSYVVAVNGGPAAQGLTHHGATMSTACAGDQVARRLEDLRRFLAGQADAA